MAEKEDFYQELDSHKKSSVCTCQTLAIGLVFLIIILASGIVFLVSKITAEVKPRHQVVATSQNTAELQKKVEELNKAPGASTTLTITEQELTGLLIEAISKNPQIPLRDLQAEITPQAIIINAKATKFLASPLVISLVPQVVDGRPKLELVKIQAGTLTVPPELTKLIADNLADTLSRQLPLQGINVKSVVLGEGKMTLPQPLLNKG